MNLPRITFLHFAKSKWLPWSLVVILMVVVSGGGYYGGTLIEENERQFKQVERLKQTVEKQTFELAQTEWALKQERNRATKKVREETRPDGTVIVEREETNEETATESEGTAQTSRSTTEREDREIQEERVEQEVVRVERESAKYRAGAGLLLPPLQPQSYEYYGTGGLRLGGLPFWLEGIITIDPDAPLDGSVGLGLVWEF